MGACGFFVYKGMVPVEFARIVEWVAQHNDDALEVNSDDKEYQLWPS